MRVRQSNYVHDGLSQQYRGTYIVWRNMLTRCSDPKHKQFKDYGGRGITVCESWSESFSAFLRDMGERPQGRSLDRIDNDKGYDKANCRWATRAEQASNTSRNVKLTFSGRTMSIKEWATDLGIPYGALQQRIKAGWDTEKALMTPLRSTVRTKP